MDRRVSRLVFDLSDSDFFLVRASRSAECRIRLEEALPRSDDSVLEFVSITGADPDSVQSLIAEEDDVRSVRVLHADADEALFEIVSETAVATALADHGSIFTNIVARAGNGRLSAEIPAHMDVSMVVDAFLEQYPGARLVSREATDRSAPTMTSWQYRNELLSSLTGRQLEALRAAHAAGYFEWPRRTQTEDIATRLDISSATFSEHLRVAMGKVFDTLFHELGDV